MHCTSLFDSSHLLIGLLYCSMQPRLVVRLLSMGVLSAHITLQPAKHSAAAREQRKRIKTIANQPGCQPAFMHAAEAATGLAAGLRCSCPGLRVHRRTWSLAVKRTAQRSTATQAPARSRPGKALPVSARPSCAEHRLYRRQGSVTGAKGGGSALRLLHCTKATHAAGDGQS